MEILIVLPVKPKVVDDKFRTGANPEIESKFMKCLEALESKYDFSVHIDDTSYPSQPTDCRPWSKITRIRNAILDSVPWKDHTHLLWIDADLVQFPPNLIDLLVEANPDGVSAPMVLVEGTVGFYDRAAFVIRGAEHVDPNNITFLHGRNLDFNPPYWPKWNQLVHHDMHTSEYMKEMPAKDQNIVEMDCVGSCLLVNTDIYNAGARYEDHPAFTDHFPICKKARDLGRKVTVRRDLFVYHANLPLYGEKWH